MYHAHYGFRELPFNQTPDSSFFFPSERHKTALDALVYAIKQRKGFVLVTGEIGSGKTTVARTLLRKLGSRAKTAMITNTYLTPKGIITLILEDLDVSYQTGSKDRLLVQLNEFLLAQAQQDLDVIVLVDEAQNLNPQCLEEIRMLSNLETEKEKLIQIILIGQPELRKKIETPRLEQLRQRIAIHYHLEPLSELETKEYILHRLNHAKANGRDFSRLFEAPAYELVYQYSRGLPRLVNKVCDHALFTGWLYGAQSITESIVAEAVNELHFRGEKGEETGEKKHEQIYKSA